MYGEMCFSMLIQLCSDAYHCDADVLWFNQQDFVVGCFDVGFKQLGINLETVAAWNVLDDEAVNDDLAVAVLD